MEDTGYLLIILGLGIPIFVLVRVIQGIYFFRTLKSSKKVITILFFSQAFSIIFTVFFWTIWLFNLPIEPFYRLINLPAIIAEILILSICFTLKNYFLRWA